MWTSAVADSGWKLLGILGPVDIGVALMLLAAFAVGFWTGLIWQIVCLVSVVACLWVSVTYHPVVEDFFGADGGGATGSIISGIGVFLCALLVCYLITFLFRGLINAIRPQLPDRIIGSVFGLFVGALVVGVCSFFVLNYGNEETTMRRYVAESKGARRWRPW